MQKLISFYQGQIDAHTTALVKVKESLALLSAIRLALFAVTVVGLYLVFGQAKWVFAIILVSVALFLFLVSRHTDLKYKRDKLKALIKLSETEIKVQQREFQARPNGEVYKNPSHYFSQDIDLYGKGSFYQYSNRTALEQGSQLLVDIYNANTIEDIPQKQEAIQELSKKPEWRQEYSAVASLAKAETSTQSIEKWLSNYSPFVPRLMRYFPQVFSVISLGLMVLYFLGFVWGWWLVLQMIIGLIISGFFLKKIMTLGEHSSKIQSTFQQYNQLILIIENTNFQSTLLQEKRKTILTKEKKTSSLVKEFSSLLGRLDQNNNVFYLIFGNGFFLGGLASSHKLEHWIAEHGPSVRTWFETCAFFDAYISLGTFAFNHPNYTFPKITGANVVLQSKGAGHPLLDPVKSVLNDFKIDNEQFFIITGANMAGKSTFLRTVSLQIVMANIGLPVCAKEVLYNPVKLITSMRTTDSLSDDESYFFSELKRLKFIVDEIKRDRYFIVLDEILKGTNSTDKAKGSRKFIEKLVASKSTGIIATHDLSLCEVEQELPQIKNYYFDAEISNNELYFDYTFKSGICQNMNASFLLKKMNIVD